MSTQASRPLAVPDIAGSPQAAPYDPEHGLPATFGQGWKGRLLFWIAVAFSAFQIVTAFGIPLDFRILPAIAWLTPILLIRIAFVLWLGWILLGAARGRPNLEAVLAFLTLFGAFELVTLYTGTLPNQVLRTLHVGFLSLTACGLLANADETSPPARAFWWAVGVA